MWLDRISGHSTPSRPFSPASRRPSHLSPSPHNNRSALLPKSSSSVSLLSRSDSSTSLPATYPATNGSGLKSTAKGRPLDVSDPLQVLNGIIGKPNGATPKADLASAQPEVKPEQLVEDIDFGGRSLQEYVAKEDESRRISTSDVGSQTIQQFEKERDKFQDLHTSIFGCDDVSRSVEVYLNDFQTELGAVSAEIESLQTRSVQLNAMLENRRNVERLLGPAVEEISISPRAVRLIAEGPIDENWVRALNELDARATGIEAKIASSSSTKAIEDVRPLLTDIKNKVGIIYESDRKPN